MENIVACRRQPAPGGRPDRSAYLFCGQVNTRPRRITRRPHVQMLAEGQAWLHPVPAEPFTAALGVTRKALRL